MAEWIAEYKYKRLDEINNVINDVFRFKCSSCGWQTGQQGISFQFCPICGEKMSNANNPKVIPITVLEDIKAEIEKYHVDSDWTEDYGEGFDDGIEYSLDVIDKHISGKMEKKV